MNMNKNEELMYSVMKSIYNSNIPINFKGSMVLKACLHEAGYSDGIRHTVDIDASWYSEKPLTAEHMTQSLQNAIQKCGENLEVKLCRMYGEKRSAGFEIVDNTTNEILFTMDIDINRPILKTKIYEMADIQFQGVVPSQIMADKLFVVSTDKVFSRIKDIIDIYYMSKVFSFDKKEILNLLKDNNRNLGDFHAFLFRINDLQHSYEKFRFSGDDIEKPKFLELYSDVKKFIQPFFIIEKQLSLQEQMDMAQKEAETSNQKKEAPTKNISLER